MRIVIAILAIVGMMAGIVGLFAYLFYRKRAKLRAFVDKHGLEVTGMGPGEYPEVTGRFRDVSVLIDLISTGGETTTTRMVASFEEPLPKGLLITARDGGEPGAIQTGISEVDDLLHIEGKEPEAIVALFQTEAFFGVVRNFFRQNASGFIREDGVGAVEGDGLLTDHQILEKMLQETVDTAKCIQKVLS